MTETTKTIEERVAALETKTTTLSTRRIKRNYRRQSCSRECDYS